MQKPALRIALGLLLAASGCKVVNTGDDERVTGRGAAAFDPYDPSTSGAVKLSLQWYRGCAILANGQPVAKGNARVPYPSDCPNPLAVNPTQPPRVVPTARLKLLTDTRYFLNQLTLIDSLAGAHQNPAKLSEATRWMKEDSRFKSLDWTDLAQTTDSATMNGDLTWNREVFFENAAWMKNPEGKFVLDVLGADGDVRTSVTYTEAEFLGTSSTAGHSRASWKVSNVLPPAFHGDITVRNAPNLAGPPSAAFFRTMVRVDFTGSINPFKSFVASGLQGEAAIRVTWSKMPNSPFVFPVEFVAATDLPVTCFAEDDSKVPCAFGLDPRVKLSSPANGKHYVPGETMQLVVDVRDSKGSRLHPKDSLFGYDQMYADQTNGLLYRTDAHWPLLEERDMYSSFQVGGPLQNLKTWSDPFGPPPFFNMGQHAFALVTEAASGPFLAGLFDASWPTRTPIELPADAKPGTYVAVIKTHRQFFGERESKTKSYFFQVGQAEKTTYPGRVGNCQICHRGVLSLDNLRHGLSVDNVESCKLCHAVPYDTQGRMEVEIHDIHMRSNRYTAKKGDCGMCHLTRESALRPSLDTCQSCHPSVHGGEYFQTAHTNFETPNRFGNCAQSCHVLTPPKSHILPPN